MDSKHLMLSIICNIYTATYNTVADLYDLSLYYYFKEYGARIVHQQLAMRIP